MSAGGRRRCRGFESRPSSSRGVSEGSARVSSSPASGFHVALQLQIKCEPADRLRAVRRGRSASRTGGPQPRARRDSRDDDARRFTAGATRPVADRGVVDATPPRSLGRWSTGGFLTRRPTSSRAYVHTGPPELAGESARADAEATGHRLERLAVLVMGRGQLDGSVGHLASHSSARQAQAIQVTNHRCAVYPVLARQPLDRPPLRVPPRRLLNFGIGKSPLDRV